MVQIILLCFILGYTAIIFEGSLKVNKTITALFTGTICWVIYALMSNETGHQIADTLTSHFGSICSILIFLLGAMTIVELIDLHKGFSVITHRIRTNNTLHLLWIIGFVTFFLSAILDNLATTIIMITLLKKLLPKGNTRMILVGIVIIAANAGGAWSPIGDVTTTLLWIGGQVSAAGIMVKLFVPSLVCLLVPMIIASWRMRGNTIIHSQKSMKDSIAEEKIRGSLRMLMAGVGSLLLVPVIKGITGLPPFLGVLLGLSLVCLVSETIHWSKSEEDRRIYSVANALSKIDVTSILYFMGILLLVYALEEVHILTQFASFMDENIGNKDWVVVAIGLLSSIVDNGSLVAATQGMYPLASPHMIGIGKEAYDYAVANPELVSHGEFIYKGVHYFMMDSKLWEFIAYCAGTGGSLLVIGSAAGVTSMNMEKISFVWYLKNMSILALSGFIAGMVAYLLLYNFETSLL